MQNERTIEDFFNISPKYYYVKNVNQRVDTMYNEEFEKLEAEMKGEFHKYNKGLARLIKRVKSRSKLYLNKPKAFWADLKKIGVG